MKKVANVLVRKAIKETCHAQWEVAKKLNIGETVFSRKLREELTLDEQKKLIEKINKIEW